MDLNQSELKQRNTAANSSAKESESSRDEINKNEPLSKPTEIPTVIETKEEYFNALRIWLQQVQLQQMAYSYFPYYLSSNLQQNMINNAFMPSMPFFAQPQYPAIPTMQMFNAPNIDPTSADGTQQQQIPNPAMHLNNMFQQNRNDNADTIRQNMQMMYQHGGYEYIIAPIWKRFIAETIDVVILFIIKLMIVFMLMDLFNIKLMNLDFDSLKMSLEEDYTEFLSFSSDWLLIEFLTKFMVCIYEAVWTAQGQSAVGGATPGKIIMGIRIVYVEVVVPIGQMPIETNFNAHVPMRAIMYPASNPGFRRALLRAIAKNMLMTLMFPMCFVLLFFRNNRTGYDVMTKTIVVEENPLPMRRQM